MAKCSTQSDKAKLPLSLSAKRSALTAEGVATAEQPQFTCGVNGMRPAALRFFPK